MKNIHKYVHEIYSFIHIYENCLHERECVGHRWRRAGYSTGVLSALTGVSNTGGQLGDEPERESDDPILDARIREHCGHVRPIRQVTQHFALKVFRATQSALMHPSMAPGATDFWCVFGRESTLIKERRKNACTYPTSLFETLGNRGHVRPVRQVKFAELNSPNALFCASIFTAGTSCALLRRYMAPMDRFWRVPGA